MHDEKPRRSRTQLGRLPMNPPVGVLLAVVGTLLFLSPLVPWVATVAPAWWWPFAAWAAFIALIAVSMRSRRDP